jgi:hypothetical protein
MSESDDGPSDDDPVLFGSWDGDPVIATLGEAWLFADGGWKRVHSADAGMESRLLSRAAFDRKFPRLPALPSDAFQAGSASIKARP